MNDYERLGNAAMDAIPAENPDLIEWAEDNVQFPQSVRSKRFNLSVTPWLREPLTRAVDNSTRIITLMKPVQSGGSTFGEVVMLYWIMFWRGFLQYNWSDDKRANERWSSRIRGVLESCAPVGERMLDCDVSKGEIDFGRIFFRMQGVFNPNALDSDSVTLQINEEIHDWKPGHLKKARNRSTAVWNYKSIDISNAGQKGDQLDKAFCSGTMQQWEVLCPGCSKFHSMRTKWEDRHPELGGLRYDADGCRRSHFDYDYNKLRPTIEYQMPCGFIVHNQDVAMRRQLSLSGRYCRPRNLNAETKYRSYTYEGVIVDYIDWMTLIVDKHDALRARSLGDPEPWRRYCCERECVPFDPENAPLLNITVTTKGISKNRDGLQVPKLRLFALDRQQGTLARNEFPYWWLVIRDIKVEGGKLRSLLVYEGKVESDEQVIGILAEHKCNHWQGCADSGDDTMHVYRFCIKYGINAIKGGSHDYYTHEGGNRRIFSQEVPLHPMISVPAKFPYMSANIGNGKTVNTPDPREPMFWLYSKAGIRERLYWMRTGTTYETPEDVSDDYREHQEAEERVESITTDGARVYKWIQHKRRNDLFVCEAYIAMQVDQAGMILGEMAKAEVQEPTKE